MIPTKECPKCGAEHRMHIRKCGCGHQFGQVAKPEETGDPMRGCCEYSTGTSRCHFPGAFSRGTNGDGKWYCSAHDGEMDPVIGAAIVYKSHEDYPAPDWSPLAVRRRYELRVIKAMAGAKHSKVSEYSPSKPGKDWARRIMERIKQGEKLPMIAGLMAKNVS